MNPIPLPLPSQRENNIGNFRINNSVKDVNMQDQNPQHPQGQPNYVDPYIPPPVEVPTHRNPAQPIDKPSVFNSEQNMQVDQHYVMNQDSTKLGKYSKNIWF